MIRPASEKRGNLIEIDLTGPEGNSFFLIGVAQSLSKKLGIESAEIIEKMQASDYENVVAVFEENFGEYVILYR